MDSMLKNPLMFKQEVAVNLEQISDILDAGLQGACDVWLHISKQDIDAISPSFQNEKNPTKLVMLGALLPIRDIENTDKCWGKLNVFMIINALQAMANGEDLRGNTYHTLKRHFNDFVTDNADAITYDVIMQIAVLGEVEFD